MGLVLAVDILQDVSLALIEPIVSASLVSGVPAPGPATVTVDSVNGMFVGAIVLVGRGLTSQEVVGITAVGPGTFTATFSKMHSVGEGVAGANFPSGQPEKPLFTVQEMLGYLLDVENDFLLKTQCIYDVIENFALAVNQRYYARPLQAIRLERVSVTDTPNDVFFSLKNISQSGLDMFEPGWEADQDNYPREFFEDGIGNSKFGFGQIPTAGGNVNLWFSKKDSSAVLGIDSTLVIPDVCSHYMKYGVLARAFSKDGEQRDDFRAKYCQARFDLGVHLVLHFMKGIEVLLGQEDEKISEFKRLAVPAING